MKELPFIDWIRSRSDFDPVVVPVGPGDDMAVVMSGREKILITIDQVLDGVHFVLAEHGPEAAGRKAMARNLSDVAAMAALPTAAVASVALPKGFARADAEAIYRGLRSVGDEFNCPLVGGDVGSWPGKLAITVTIFARCAEGIEPVLRSGAQVGDAICVTGQLGGAWRSDRHLNFKPRITEAVTLAGGYGIHAMIDISDGLARDLAHICRASKVGATIQGDNVPIHDDAKTHCPDSPLKSALGDGEDYELLFTLPAGQAEKLLMDKPFETQVTKIGTITDKTAALNLLHADGYTEPLEKYGWEHET